MTVVTTQPVMPREHDWTVDDLDALPDDGLQYELLDGLLLVTPAPIVAHQRALSRLLVQLAGLCPPELEVFPAPLDWRPDRRTSLQPDVLIARKDELGIKNLTETLVLAVEVLSPSTRRKDLVLKRSKYEDAGVESYWVIDPQVPSLTAWDLVDRRYVDAGVASGSDTLELQRPFPVRITPAALV